MSLIVEVDYCDEDDDDMMMKKKKTTKIIKLDIEFSNPNLIFFLTKLCQITISFKYYLHWVAAKIRLNFRPPKFRIYLDRI